MSVYQDFIAKLFSQKCRLTSLRIDICNFHGGRYNILEHLRPVSDAFLNSISYKGDQFCMTLRRLNIRLESIDFIENLFDRLPNIEQMSLEFSDKMEPRPERRFSDQLLKEVNGNWAKKVKKEKK